MGPLGPRWLNHLRAVFGLPAKRRLGRWALLVDQINALEPELQKLPDAELRKRSLDLRWQVKGGESLDRILPEAYALVRAAAERTIKLRHFDVQMVGGIALHNRSIAEMETGEGKTLTATLPAYLNALPGKGVHVVTVNDYLAKRDAEWMAPVYEMLGLTVGCVQTPMRPPERRRAYAADITYGTAKEFGFDFLRDKLQLGPAASGVNPLAHALLTGRSAETAKGVQREHNYVIIDEADSILIDEARTPLIISAPPSADAKAEIEAYQWAARIPRELVEDEHYTTDHKLKTAELTQAGRRKVRESAMPVTMATMGLEKIFEYVERAVKAEVFFIRDRQFVVVNDEVVIVDEFTGRLMPGRKWRDGLHQAVEAKAGVPVTVETGQAARTTVQSYFLRYKKLSGMTGTAMDNARELRRTYKLRVVHVPTNRPRRRQRLADRVFGTEQQKWQAVVDEISRLHRQGTPVLVGTRSIDKSEILSRLLTPLGIAHQVLNAKQHELEAQIVAQAGQPGAVTIATNMAGRGTDIRLGPGVADLGGLHVIGTERHEASRIDRQLEGRSGRQGDPGTAQFFVSLEDEILHIFGPKRAKRLRQIGAEVRNGQAGMSSLRPVFRRAQRKVERQHYKDRRQLMKYEKQRTEQKEKLGLDPVLDANEK